jgi:hypothetical protein
VEFITDLIHFLFNQYTVFQFILATGWKTVGSEFASRWSQEFSLIHIVQTGSGAHPASYPMRTVDSFLLRGKAAGA